MRCSPSQSQMKFDGAREGASRDSIIWTSSETKTVKVDFKFMTKLYITRYLQGLNFVVQGKNIANHFQTLNACILDYLHP